METLICDETGACQTQIEVSNDVGNVGYPFNGSQKAADIHSCCNPKDDDRNIFLRTNNSVSKAEEQSTISVEYEESVSHSTRQVKNLDSFQLSSQLISDQENPSDRFVGPVPFVDISDPDESGHSVSANNLFVTTASEQNQIIDVKDLISQREFHLLYVDPKSKSNNQISYPQFDASCSLNFSDERGTPKKREFKVSKTKKHQTKSYNGSKWKATSPETTLPDHLKKKPKLESGSIIDLTHKEVKPVFEKGFYVRDTVEYNAYTALQHRSSLCCFCAKPSNIGSMGKLYGPYQLNVNISAQDHATIRENVYMNVWMHKDCAVWTPIVCLKGGILAGLGTALNEAFNNKCCGCSMTGATLSCSCRGCTRRYHFFCGKKIGCFFDSQDYSMLCTRHQ